MSKDSKDARIGYCNPPQHSKFKPGQSGNPKGRPKKQPRRFAELIEQELQERVTLIENGERVSITKAEAVLKRLVNDAIKGSARNLVEVLKLIPLVDDLREERDDEKARQSLAAMIARSRREND